MSGEANAEAVLDRVEDVASDGDTSTIRQVQDALGRLGTAPVLFVPAVIGASPLGGIPAVPTLMALCVLLVSVQIAAGRERIWLPERLRRIEVGRDRLCSAIEKMQPVARKVDRMAERRFTFLVTPPLTRIAALCCIALAVIVPPLEMVPFAALLPLGAVALFALAMMLRDGLVMALAFVATGAAAYYVPGWLSSLAG